MRTSAIAFRIPVLKWIAIVIVIIAIFIGNTAYETGNITGGILGIQAVVNAPMIPIVIVLGVLAFAAMWVGSYKLVEKILTGIVIFMGLVFLITAFASPVDWGAVVAGLFTPSLPEGQAGAKGILTAVGLIGTTIVPYNLFLHASGASERFKDPEQIADARFDCVLSIGLGGIISMAILVCAAANMHAAGITVTNGKDMAVALQPLLGNWATALIGIGLLAAGFSSAITAPLSGCLRRQRRARLGQDLEGPEVQDRLDHRAGGWLPDGRAAGQEPHGADPGGAGGKRHSAAHHGVLRDVRRQRQEPWQVAQPCVLQHLRRHLHLHHAVHVLAQYVQLLDHAANAYRRIADSA